MKMNNYKMNVSHTLLRSGRSILSLKRGELDFEWYFGPMFLTLCGFKFSAVQGDGRGFKFSFNIPYLFSFYFSILDFPLISKLASYLLKDNGYYDKIISVDISNGTLYWRLWVSNYFYKNSSEWKVNYRDNCFEFLDFFLGKKIYKEMVTKKYNTYLFDKNDKISVKFIKCIWKRRFWFQKTVNRITIDIENGMLCNTPNEQKIYSFTCSAESEHEAILKLKKRLSENDDVIDYNY